MKLLLQNYRSILLMLKKDEKQRWLHYLKGHEESGVDFQVERYLENCNGIYSYIKDFSEQFSDTENDELFLLDQSQIVFASLSVCGRRTLQRLQKKFDVTVIDEAGQAVPAETLIPCRFPTKKALFVGDHMQLPATTFSETATETNFAESTLSSLINNNASYRMLNYQYRMHPEIRRFPSEHFYGGRLRDGVNIGRRANPLALLSNMDYLPYGFINISAGQEASQNHSFYNESEVNAIGRLISKINASSSTIQIGVIAFYRAQVERLQRKFNRNSNVLVSTVDGFQGGERDLIIISCVRSNPSGRIGFAKDFRRINVAITRAKHGLVLFGNINTLQKGNHILTKIIMDANQRGKVFAETVLQSTVSGDQRPKQKSSSVRPSNYRTQLCIFFARGYCKNGDDCTFKHELGEGQKNKSSGFRK